MISMEEARKIAQDLIDKSNRSLEITIISKLNAEKEEDALYLFGVKDPATNRHYYPGELFPSIRMSDGALVDFALIPPGAEQGDNRTGPLSLDGRHI